MDNQDQRRTHAQGHENHGVLVCHKCGWPFPNPHPSAKHRRAHKKICGTIEGYQVLLVSEGLTDFNPSDDEHFSDDDTKRQGRNTSDTDNNEKGSGVIGEKSIRSGDEVFSDAVADFSDGGLSPGVKEPSQDSLGLATDVEIICRKYLEFPGSSDGNGSNVADEAMPDVLLENKIYAGENVRGCSLTSVSKEITLEEKDEIKSDRDFVEIVVSSNNTGGEMCGGVSKIEVSDVVNSNYQVADGSFNPAEKNSAEFSSVMPRDDFPLDVNSAVSTNATSSDVKILQEREEGNVHVFTPPSCDDRPDVPHPQCEYEDCEVVLSQNSLTRHSSKELEQERNGLKDSVTEDTDSLTNQGQLSGKREVLSQDEDMHAFNSNMEKEQVYCELTAEESIEVFPGTFKVESNKRLYDTGASMNAMKSEMNKSHRVHFSEEQGSDDVPENSQLISLSDGSFMATSNDNPSDAFFGSAASETAIVISRDNISHHEKNITGINDIAADGKCGGANIGNGTGISMKTLQPSDLNSEIKPSSVYKSDAVEMGKYEKCDIKFTQYTESPIVKDTTPPASSNFESPILSEVETDGSARTPKGIECTNRGPLSGPQEDIKDDETNSNARSQEDCNSFAGTITETHQAQDGELLLKANEGLGRDYSSDPSLNIEPSAQHAFAVKETEDEEPEETRSGTGNSDIKLASSAIYTSVDPGNRCDSLEANWGSVSVLSVQSDAQAAIEAEDLRSTDLLPSTEVDKSNLKDPEAAVSESQHCDKTEMFEPPSFMTLVEPGHAVDPKPAASEVQIESSKEHPNSTSSQAGWFPTLTHVTNESQGRKRNEEIIAKVTNRNTSKQQHTPLKSLLGEAAHSSKPKSPKLGKNSANQKNGKVPEDNDSGLTTVNSILGRESPAAQAVKGEGAKEWNSPAKYPADIKREKKKMKSRPYWIPFVCCSSVDTR